MASEGAWAKRTNLVPFRVHWSHMDSAEFITAHDQEAHEPLRRNTSSDDDLALGVEASLYGSQRVRTVQEFLRWSRSSPALSRWSSFSSATSGHSRPHSVMDILNLWNDDPEEVLLDLGFGCDEPDLSGRIPARFINHQSQARGINLQVFLEAQKNRLDLENPDVSNRFRQLEVIQQVTTAFSSLMRSSSSSPLRAPLGKTLSPEARERRKRMGIMFRRASKKSLSQIHNRKTQDLTKPDAKSSPCVSAESLQPPVSLGDKNIFSKRLEPGLLETVCLSPLTEEKSAGPDTQPQPNVAPLKAQEGALRHLPLTANTFLLRKKSPRQLRESFEIEEATQGFIRSNSCQSDSSGFLEEPFIPPLSQQASPGADLIKVSSLTNAHSQAPLCQAWQEGALTARAVRGQPPLSYVPLYPSISPALLISDLFCC
ncbi:protein ITPRID1-like [Anoplopoma fimbria]|uniref:protein ITPRID1-like n=1 Tax=Anoplopoma fimbria TaxID=229290 RepID=UPI0023EDE252|nr:protein ITPRID1-like [Anoplopoma fimbria]